MLFGIVHSRLPWLSFGFAALSTILLVAGAHFKADLHGYELMIAAIALGTVARKDG